MSRSLTTRRRIPRFLKIAARRRRKGKRCVNSHHVAESITRVTPKKNVAAEYPQNAGRK